MRRSSTEPGNRVLAILVVHGEQPWHDVVASRLAERAHVAPMSLLVVDNGAPQAARIAAEAGADLLQLPRVRSFGGAVAAAVNHPLAEEAEFVLLLHDDLILDAEALPRMLEVMDTRPAVAVTGPKLLDWRREPLLQQVGMTIDTFGRAESHLSGAELDQGQHDHRDRSLYVSSAGMLIRKHVFVELGGFDPRFSAMRDDLDLCWRAWLAGHTVEVVPEAVGWHISAAARSVRRKGRGRRATTRYLAERHTLAAMIKNYGLLRLAWTLPLYVLLALFKSVGFALTRRVASAAAPLAAIAWNVRSLPGTLRLRGATQRSRQRSDSELTDLFAHGSWRRRAYVEALADWISGTDTTALVREETVIRRAHRSERSVKFRAVDRVRDRPAAIVGGVLALVWLIMCIPLLGGGQLIGGQVAAWPAAAGDFLAAYTSGWGTGPLASGAFPAPVQPVLAMLAAIVGGGAWAAQRLVVLGLVPLIWLVTLRAGRLITSHPGPRVLGATVYTVSPLVLGAFAQGRIDALSVAAVLPTTLLLAARAGQPGVSPGKAWRATALLAVVTSLAIAVAPGAWPVVVLPSLVVAGLASRNRSARSRVAWRLLVAGLGVVGLLLPWLIDLGTGTTDTFGSLDSLATQAPLRMWEAAVGYVQVLPGLAATAGWLWIAAAAAVIVAALVFGLRERAATVFLLMGTMIAFAAATAVVARGVEDVVWPPMVALPAALALGGLAVTAARSAADVLRHHDFGFRHVVALLSVAAVVLGPIAVTVVSVTLDEWPQVRRAPELLPLFVQADAERLGPYRILVLEGDDAQMSWAVTEASGPQMTAFGTRADSRMVAAVDGVLEGLLAGEAQAAGRAGLLNVRYLVLRDAATRAAVAPALADLAGVEPLAAGGGRVYEVRTWLPRAAVVDRELLQRARDGQPLPPDRVEESRLAPVGVGRYAGGPAEGDLLLLSEAADPAWIAQAGGRPLEEAPVVGDALPIMAFSVAGEVEGIVADAAPATRPVWLVWQVVVLLTLLSLALRAPGRVIKPAPVDPQVLPEAATWPRSQGDRARGDVGSMSNTVAPGAGRSSEVATMRDVDSREAKS